MYFLKLQLESKNTMDTIIITLLLKHFFSDIFEQKCIVRKLDNQHFCFTIAFINHNQLDAFDVENVS